MTSVSLHFCPTPPTTTFRCQQHQNKPLNHPHSSTSNQSHVWRKIWRKSCSWQKLPISIGQSWSGIPCWSCPPSPPQGQLCPTSRCRCTWYVALSHPSMDAVLIRVQSTSQQSLSTSQLKSSSWQAMLPVITRNVCDPSLNLKLTSARIIPRHLQLAIRNDEELNKYVSRYVISC